MKKECVNCPGATDHTTAECPLVSAQKNELREVERYRNMFNAAVYSLAEIDRALGITEETHAVGGAGAALAEIKKLQDAQAGKGIIINGYQLREAMEFLAPDNLPEQLDGELCLLYGGTEFEDGPGLFAYHAEYPEEGCCKLAGTAEEEQPGAGVEEVEVVAWQDAENPLYTTAERRVMHEWAGNQYPIVELMTVAQHNRIVAAISAQQSAPERGDGWIPVSERLPDIAQEVIVNSEFDGVTAAFLDSYGEWYSPNSDYKLTRVVAWKNLPAAPSLLAQQSVRASVPREWLDAVKELFDAKQAKEDFERENPGNSTKRWDACLYRIEAAEDALRALLASVEGGE